MTIIVTSSAIKAAGCVFFFCMIFFWLNSWGTEKLMNMSYGYMGRYVATPYFLEFPMFSGSFKIRFFFSLNLMISKMWSHKTVCTQQTSET